MQNSIFKDIIGHNKIKSDLEHILASKKIPHSILMSGPKGVGKYTMAIAFVKEIFKDLPGVNNRIAKGTLSDFMYVTTEESKDINAAQIREIGEFLSLTAAESRYRVVIINNAEKMNKYASNALLKILEEPPAYAIIIIISHNLASLLPTIRSRCHLLKFYPVSNLNYASQELSTMSAGCPGYNIFLEKYNAEEIYNFLKDGYYSNDHSWVFNLTSQFPILTDEKYWQSFITALNLLLANIAKSYINNDDTKFFSKITKKYTIKQWIENYFKINEMLNNVNLLNLDKKHVLLVIKSILCKEI
jgi:replication-associated recombination protein RarA